MQDSSARTIPLIKPLHLMVFMVIVGVVGILLLNHIARKEEDRELAHWQSTLNLIADSRASDIEHWLSDTQQQLTAVAKNPSLELYMTTLLAGQPMTPSTEDPAQRVFLRNLLISTAERLGFTAPAPESARVIEANVTRETGIGLMITDSAGKPLVATEGLSAPDASLLEKIKQAPKGKATLLDIFTTPEGKLRIGFVLPIYPVQADEVAAQQMGMLVGIRPVTETLRGLLVQPGVTDTTLEAVLVRPQGDSVEYLDIVPPAHPVASVFLRSTPHLDAAYAIDNTGQFALMRDRFQHAVLMTSRRVAGSPWVLLQHIDRDQALAVSDGERIRDEIMLVVAWVALMAIIVAAWWYGASHRTQLLFEQADQLATHATAQERLLRLITDSQPAAIFIADKKDVVHFANKKAAEVFHITAQDADGKTLASLFGPAIARKYSDENDAALAQNTALSLPPYVTPDGRIVRTEHIPLSHIPVEGLGYPTQGVLVVEQDVTDIVREREWRERVLKQLVQTLVRLVDARDPYAANHSAAVARLSREVAGQLALAPLLIQTAETAGQLMNIGKIVVSSKILTQESALAKEEKQAIEDSLHSNTTLLEGIEFEGPVIDTLRQSIEWVDGSGPMGLKGDAILITARIIAAANSFVGMISPRAYREALTLAVASEQLLAAVDTHFDRHVVIALMHFIENQHGKEVVAGIIEGVKKT